MQGFIKSIKLDKGFGFIAVLNGPDLFFYCKDLAPGLAFDESLLDRRVECNQVQTGRGPAARDVRPAESM